MRLCKSLILLLLSFLPLALNAQISHGGSPMPEQLAGVNALRSGSDEWVRMPRLDTTLLLAQEGERTVRCGGERFAYAFPVDLSPENSGAIYHMADGTAVWRLHIVSEGAYSLNIIFGEYELKGEAQLFLYAPDRSAILGSFTAENNSPSGVLATAPIDGDEVVVELIIPKGSDAKLKIESVNHDYKGLRKTPSYGTAAACQVDYCEVGGHELQARSSVVYIVEGVEYCSGNMINNTRNDGTPYLITSSHCLFDRNDNFVESKAAKSVFFFNYAKPHCLDGVRASTEMSVAGSEVVFKLVSSDALLLKLSDRPPLDYEVYYAGWNMTKSFEAPFYDLHHPNSDVLKISVEEDNITLGSFDYNGLFKANKHWVVKNWEMGIMEGGSSGSALFDAQGYILGSLSGGAIEESCNKPGYDTYWALSEAWSEGIGRILDPEGKATTCEGMEANAVPCQRLTNWRSEDLLHEMSEYEEYAAGHNQANLDEYAERFRTGKEKSVLYGIHFLAYKGYYEEQHPVLLRVYSGDTLPKEVILEEPIQMVTNEYKTRSGFQTSPVNNWEMRDNYYRLTQPIVVDSTFFIGVKLDNESEKYFALCHTDISDMRLNTAYFKNDTQWYPFEGEHPYYPYATSLFIEPEVQVGCAVVKTVDYVTDASSVCWVNNPVTESVRVQFPTNTKLISYEIYSIGGERVAHVEVGKDLSQLEFEMAYPAGLYILRLVFDSHVESLKLLKR